MMKKQRRREEREFREAYWSIPEAEAQRTVTLDEAREDEVLEFYRGELQQRARFS